MIKIFFFGDIVSRVGREGVKKILPTIKKEFAPDLIMANGENVSHGHGLSEEHFKELKKAGIKFFTGGNHIWGRKDTLELLAAKDPKVIRPANYPPETPGVGYKHLTLGKNSIIVLNLQGRVFMSHHIDCPFQKFDDLYKSFQNISYDALLVDFHAEATSEKVAFGQYVDGRADVVFGTHTHIQTADEQILPKGTAYITDVGGCYAQDSVIGVRSDIIIERFKKQVSEPFRFPTKGKCVINGIYLEIDKKGTQTIKRVQKEIIV